MFQYVSIGSASDIVTLVTVFLAIYIGKQQNSIFKCVVERAKLECDISIDLYA